MATPFLAGVQLRPIHTKPGAALQAVGLALGHGQSALEVMVTQARTKTCCR